MGGSNGSTWRHGVVLGGRQRGSLTRGGDDDTVFGSAAVGVIAGIVAAVTGTTSKQANRHNAGQQ